MNSRSAILKYMEHQDKVRQFLLALAGVSALSLSACSMDMPTKMTESRIELSTEQYSQSYDVATLNDANFDAMADHYVRSGSSQAEVIVAYDPYSKKNTAMKANDQLARIKTELSTRGITDLKGSTLAIDHSGDSSEMIIGYESVTAGVNDCRMMPGYATNHMDADFDYKLGCSVQTLMAKQVAHPADLAGRAPDTDADGRRTGAVVERYRSGEPADDLGTYTTTGD